MILIKLGSDRCCNRLQTTVAISNQVMHLLQMAYGDWTHKLGWFWDFGVRGAKAVLVI